MSLVKFRAKNHPQQTTTDAVDDRATTLDVFAPLNDRYRFTVDVAASASNTKLPRYYTIDENGLDQSWAGERVWCNPPYSNIRPWVEKAHAEQGADWIVMLLPANRTEQAWWQDLVEPYRDQDGRLSVEFLRGRLRFDIPGGYLDPRGNRPPFGCCLLVWGRR